MGIVFKQSLKNTLFIYLGFAFGGINTLFLYTRFLEDEYYVITPDIRGMGDSERTLDKKHYSKDELGKDIISILDDLKIDKFYLAGHDWGSGVAQEVAHQITPRIKKLITLNFPIIQNEIYTINGAEMSNIIATNGLVGVTDISSNMVRLKMNLLLDNNYKGITFNNSDVLINQ